MRPRFYCTRCGRNEIEARDKGCPWFSPACPMELNTWWRRILFYKFGILL